MTPRADSREFDADLSDPLAPDQLTDPFHKAALSVLQFAPDEDLLQLFQVSNDPDSGSALGLFRIAVDRMCDPRDREKYMATASKATWLLTQIMGQIGEQEAGLLGETFWGFGFTERTWTLPSAMLATVDTRRWMDPRHHPDRIPEIAAALALHDHRVILVSATPERPPLVTELTPAGAERLGERSQAIANLLAAVDLAAEWCRRTGRILQPTTEVVYP